MFESLETGELPLGPGGEPARDFICAGDLHRGDTHLGEIHLGEIHLGEIHLGEIHLGELHLLDGNLGEA